MSSVELAGQPDLNAADFMPLLEQHGGEDFSADKIDQSIAALQRTGKFKDVQLDLRPEQEGVRVMFVLQPAVYFGTYQFPGGEDFPIRGSCRSPIIRRRSLIHPSTLKKAREPSRLFFDEMDTFYRKSIPKFIPIRTAVLRM